MSKVNLILDKEITSSLTVSLIPLAVVCLYLGTLFCASRRPVLDSYVLSSLVLDRRHYLLANLNIPKEKYRILKTITKSVLFNIRHLFIVLIQYNTYSDACLEKKLFISGYWNKLNYNYMCNISYGSWVCFWNYLCYQTQVNKMVKTMQCVI